jgi:hypothetical protein
MQLVTRTANTFQNAVCSQQPRCTRQVPWKLPQLNTQTPGVLTVPDGALAAGAGLICRTSTYHTRVYIERAHPASASTIQSCDSPKLGVCVCGRKRSATSSRAFWTGPLPTCFPAAPATATAKWATCLASTVPQPSITTPAPSRAAPLASRS